MSIAKLTDKQMENIKLLIVEDCDDDLLLVKRALTKVEIPLSSYVVSNRADYEKALTEFSPEVIVCDHSLPQFNSVEALNIAKAHAVATGNTIPFILVTGSVSEEFAAHIIKAGADDYILKDRLTRLPSAIQNALVKRKTENDKIKYIAAIEEQNEKLREIAWMQSHEVRAPLSRIMGLVALVHHKEATDLDDILNRLLESARELDAIIKKIVDKTQDFGQITTP